MAFSKNFVDSPHKIPIVYFDLMNKRLKRRMHTFTTHCKWRKISKRITVQPLTLCVAVFQDCLV